MPLNRSRATIVVLALGALVPHAASAATPPGGLVQAAPPHACFSTTAAGGCTALGNGGAISGANGVVTTPDGRDVYAVGGNGGSAAFRRDGAGLLTSVLSPLSGDSLATAPDGSGLAVAHRQTGGSLGAVQTLVRDPATGALSAGAKISDSCGASECATDNGLADVKAVAFSPDGKSLYAVAESGGGSSEGAVTAFARNPTTQAISLIQCVPRVQTAGGVCQSSPAAEGLSGARAVVVSPDRAFVYVAGGFDNAVVGFNRVSSGVGLGKLGAPVNCLISGPSTNICAQTPGLAGANGLAMSPDGRDLYVTSQHGGVSVLRRNTISGVLSFTACFDETTTGGCTVDPALTSGAPRDVAVSPDGRYVYVAAGNGSDGLLRSYRRDASTGALTPLSCLTHLVTPVCESGAGLKSATDVSVSPDGRNVYATSHTGGNGSGAISAFAVQPDPSVPAPAAPAPAGPAPAVPAPVPPSTVPQATRPAPGLTPVALTLAALPKQRTRKLGAKGLRVRATCRPGCVLRLTVTLPASEAKRLRLGRRSRIVATSQTTLAAGRPRTITLRLARATKSALRRASRARFSVTASASARGSETAAKRMAVTVRR